MNKPNLYQEWTTEELPYKDTELAKKTFSYRLPVHIAARLAAIEEMFPIKSRTEVLIGILKMGLVQFQESLPIEDITRPMSRDEAEQAANHFGDGIDNYLGGTVNEGKKGPQVDYIKKANKHFVELEIDRGIPNPPKEVFKL